MSGKTTVGAHLAKRLNWNFIDTDRLIEKDYALKFQKKYTCRQIFSIDGEEKFRQLEKQTIATLKETTKTVIALGGGTLNDSENRKVLQSMGHLIYLKAPLFILWNRIKSPQLPAYLDREDPEKAFYEMAKKRLPIYEEIAEFIIEVDSELNMVMSKIWQVIHSEIFSKLLRGANLTAKPWVSSSMDAQQV